MGCASRIQAKLEVCWGLSTNSKAPTLRKPRRVGHPEVQKPTRKRQRLRHPALEHGRCPSEVLAHHLSGNPTTRTLALPSAQSASLSAPVSNMPLPPPSSAPPPLPRTRPNPSPTLRTASSPGF